MASTSERENPTSSSSSSSREYDPLLRDLSEKKQNFRRNVVSLATELKEVRTKLSLQEQSYVKESLTRQEAEAKAKGMEEEVYKLNKSLEKKNKQLHATASNAVKYLKGLDDLKVQLTMTQATADASAASAQSAQFQCLALLKDLDVKNNALKEHEDRVMRLAEQLDKLQKDLESRESLQLQLKDEVVRVERDIMEAMSKSGMNSDCELRRILDEVSPKNLANMNRLLSAKDDDIAKLRDEIRVLTVHWKLKTEEFETQLEKHRKVNQELKRRVMKLEFCLQEARSQTRKLQRSGERRDKAIKELRDQVAVMKQNVSESSEKPNFWESQSFKFLVSMSMVMLVVFSRR